MIINDTYIDHVCGRHIIMVRFITKTSPCNEHPVNPSFIWKNWGLQGCTVLLFLLQNIDCGYSFEPPQLRRFLRVHIINVLSKNKKNIENFHLKVTIF